ncbi:MAG: four helix bundle protein [Vicingaceae bacterium]
MKKQNIILDKTIDFALAVIDFCEVLDDQKRDVISRQLLKSATSIGANVHEAQNCESKADFIHKMKIAAKEAEETKYWLTLCKRSSKYPNNEKLESSIQEINLIIYKILSSSIKNRKK